MKIAYGTYGMPDEPADQVLPRLARMGYEAVELCVLERYPTHPGKLSSEQREALRGQAKSLGLGLPALMLGLRMLTPDPKEYQRQLDEFRLACELAKDLTGDESPPVLVTTLGGGKFTWDKDRDAIAERVVQFGELAAERGCRFALEPHIGGVLDRPERVVWLMKQVASPTLGINFDISHFAVAGYSIEETVPVLTPYAIHTHVKDGYMKDGKVQFLLPGKGDFDYVAYFKAMADAGWTGCICVEVSGMIFNQPEHDPWEAAEFCLKTLREARSAAGVE